MKNITPKYILEKAKKALDKKATYASDIDLSIYNFPEYSEEEQNIEDFPPEIQNILRATGMEIDEKRRSGSFIMVNHSVVYEKINQSFNGQLEIMGITDALKKYPELVEKYLWKLISPDKDKYTAWSALHGCEGYFIRVFKNQKVSRPIQSCLLTKDNLTVQNVHNIIVLEEGASAHIISGCTVHPNVKEGLHLGMTEMYLEEDSKLTFTMIHNWADEFAVRPRTVIDVGKNASFTNNYVLTKPAKSIQSYPLVLLRGDNSKSSSNSIIYGLADSEIDIGTDIELIGKNSKGEIVSRSVAKDNSIVNARGHLNAKTDDCFAHLDCRGILMSKEATMYSVPELTSTKSPKAHLSHEAAIGPIADEEIEYLMSRGLTKDKAISMITNGFLDVKLLELPEQLESYIKKMIEATTEESL